MDGFKNSTKMKYMCGGPVRKATGGVIKSAAPKGLLKTAAGAKVAAKAMDTAKTAPKGLLKSAAGAKIAARASDLAKQLPTPEVASKRQVQPTPPKDVVREAPRPTVEPKRQVHPTPPKNSKTMGGAPKDAKTIGGAAQTMGGASRDAKAIGSVGVVKKGVPVASNKPMIGLKTGGSVTKSMCKW